MLSCLAFLAVFVLTAEMDRSIVESSLVSVGSTLKTGFSVNAGICGVTKVY